jgi:hypothetical protein
LLESSTAFFPSVERITPSDVFAAACEAFALCIGAMRATPKSLERVNAQAVHQIRGFRRAAACRSSAHGTPFGGAATPIDSKGLSSVAGMSSRFGHIAKTESGQTLSEYAVILTVVGVTTVLAIALLADSIGLRITDVASLFR